MVTMSGDDFIERCMAFKAKVNIELFTQIAEEWKNAKQHVDVVALSEYYLNRHPTEPLPPPNLAKRKSENNKGKKKK